MTAKLDYRWNLRQVMATREMFSTSALRPLLAERGIDLSPSQVYRLVAERPERLSLKILVALLDILDCSMDDLIEPIAADSAPRSRKTVGASKGTDTGVGSFRPKPARITR
ncbi:helix-turn-helix domain-containing protein [Nocardia sp. ET3-3]|uniref:Helix-turn-helix domain-containing protein n=1 Tax=Nocardia terrae TaxID=2675851 RepID=A0A7K1US88_9NOCA|nr:helix-turn-helix domain-containing protein [Nocardia terrae]